MLSWTRAANPMGGYNYLARGPRTGAAYRCVPGYTSVALGSGGRRPRPRWWYLEASGPTDEWVEAGSGRRLRDVKAIAEHQECGGVPRMGERCPLCGHGHALAEYGTIGEPPVVRCRTAQGGCAAEWLRLDWLRRLARPAR